jgi:hypothetical protein
MVLVAVLDRLHPVLHLLRDGSGLNVVFEPTFDKATFPADLAHRTDNGSSTCAKDFHHAALIGGIGYILHGELLLEHFPSLGFQSLPREAEDRVSRDAFKDSAVKGRSEQLWLTRLLVLDSCKQVHGADLSHVLLLAK